MDRGSGGEEGTGDIYFEVNYPFKETSALAAVQPEHCKEIVQRSNNDWMSEELGTVVGSAEGNDVAGQNE